MSLRDRVAEITWYHSLDLPGDVVTDGIFDLRDKVHEYGLPDRLDGKRCLDIGTWDGFWAFEMERRGASEVVAFDIDEHEELDWPPRRRPAVFERTDRGRGFRLAAEALGSSVDRRSQNIYTAFPEDVGTFDLIFCGSVVLHLRDQLLALERIANLTAPGGTFITAEEYDRPLSLLPIEASRYRANREQAVVFWLPSIRTWRSMLWTAGFDDVKRFNRFTLHSERNYTVPHVVHHARKAPAAAG